MAPELPPPTRGGLDLGKLLSAPLKGRKPVKPWHERQGFFVRDGIYVLRRFDPISLSHVCWDKLAFCDLTRRLLVRRGKLPELDPSAILEGLRTSLQAVPAPSKTLQERIARLCEKEVHAAFARRWKSNGPVASTLGFFEIFSGAELRKRSAEKSIALALDEIARPRPGLSETHIEEIRAQAIKSDAVMLSSSALEESTLHATVRELTNKFVEDINTDLLKTSLRKNPWQPNGDQRFEDVVDDYVKHAHTEAEMTAGIMTGEQIESFASRLAKKRRIDILKARYLIDDALAGTLLSRAEKKGQREPYLALIPTRRETQAFAELVGGADAASFHLQVTDRAVAMLPKSRQLTGPGLESAMPIIDAAARVMRPSLQLEEAQLMKEHCNAPEQVQIQALQLFRDGVVEGRMGALLDFATALNASVTEATSAPTLPHTQETEVFVALSRAAKAWRLARSLGVTEQDCQAWLKEAATLAVTSRRADASGSAAQTQPMGTTFSTAIQQWGGLNEAKQASHPDSQKLLSIMRTLKVGGGSHA